MLLENVADVSQVQSEVKSPPLVCSSLIYKMKLNK